MRALQKKLGRSSPTSGNSSTNCTARQRKKEAELLQLREDIRAAERALDVRDPDNSREVMSAKVEEVASDIADRAETKLVYEHMLNRLRKEVVILRQKVGKLDKHLERKNREVERRL